MIKHNQDGATSVLIAAVLGVLLVLALGFGGWAFVNMQDYKNNSDEKSAAAVKVAKQEESTAKDAQFAEERKNPLRTYNGPQAYGSMVVKYPNTWSGYVDVSQGDGQPVDGYWYPGIVPSINAESSVFALRVQVLGQSYSSILQEISGQGDGQAQTISAYALPKVPKAVGVKVTGALRDGKNGTMVLLPLRDQTLQIWTEGTQFTKDFNNIILPNFSFSP